VASTAWAICQFLFRGPFLLLRYSDSWSRRRLLVLGDPTGIKFDALAEPIASLLDRAQQGSLVGPPSAVALFYSPPKDLDLPHLEAAFLDWIARRPGSQRIQLVRLSRAAPLRRTRFRLPLSILYTRETAPLLGDFLRQDWLQGDAMKEFGLRTEILGGDLELTLRSNPFSILVTHEFRAAIPLLRRLPESLRPRLAVQTGLLPKGAGSVAGVAVLELREAPPPAFLENFLLGIVHDLPLHQAVLATGMSPSVALTADPLSNQSLRLSQALIDLKKDADRLHARYPPAKPPLFRFIQSDALTLLNERKSADSFEPALELRNAGAAIFDRETTGLLPMAQVADSLKRLAADPPIPQPAETGARRVLDAALMRIETGHAFTHLDTTESLEARAEYQLRVHIGSRFPESLVTGDVAAIDDLVGSPDDPQGGHQIDISVQGKDFRVLSKPSERVLLPRTGSTDPVYFRIRAPQALGEAKLRITVHHRNHLVQSFLLQATIAAREAPGSKLEITQEFARSVEFANLDQLLPRKLFIGLNQGQDTHEIRIQADQAATDLNLSASAYDQAVKDVRKALYDAVVVPNQRVARTYPKVVPGNAPGSDASNAFRSLAKLGRAVYDALFSALPPGSTRKSIVRLQGSSGDKIQIVRFEARSAFPWTLLYDWDTPDDPVGTPVPSPVCLGYVPQGGQAVACNHGPTDKVYCVRGFWGVRHIVEELLPQQRNANQTVTRPAADVIRVVASTSLAQAQTLQTNLNASCGAGVVVPGPSAENKLLDLLWQTPSVRPAVLIVLGHLETLQIVGQPDTPRVEMQPSAEWFTLKHLLERASKAPDLWDDPRTVVIFAPCEGAAIDEDTLNNFVSALNSAGAGAIIGMQSVIGGNQATDFAEKLTTRLWSLSPLGEVMQAVRGEAVMGGDPGGFLLQSFGDIDLKLQ
jgi:hypothetical protein